MPNKNTVLFTFDSIIDIKLAAVLRMRQLYDSISESSIINLKELHKYSITELRMQRMDEYKFYRKFFTFGEGTEDKIDRAFDIFIKNEQEHILGMDNMEISAATTNLSVLANAYLNKSEGCIHPRVHCETEKQKQIISSILPNMPIIMGSKKDVDIKPYSRMVLGDIMDIHEYQDPELKDFMIVNYRENFMEDNPKLLFIPIVVAYRDVNTFTVATAYRKSNRKI